MDRIMGKTKGQRNTLAEAILLTRGHHSCLTSLPYPTMASRDAPPCFQSPWTRTHPAVRHAPPRFFHSFWLSLSPSTGNNMNFLDLSNGQLVYALPDRCHYRAKPKIRPRFAFSKRSSEILSRFRAIYIYNIPFKVSFLSILSIDSFPSIQETTFREFPLFRN